MFNKNNWKEPIYKNDVLTVIIFGLTGAILGGILTGLIEAALTNAFHLGISFGLLINSLIVGFAVKKGYESYHILYPVLALVFFIVALFFDQVAYYVGMLGIQQFGTIMSSPELYKNFLLLPILFLFEMIDGGFDIVYLLYLILNIIFYILGFVATYRIAKGNHR